MSYGQWEEGLWHNGANSSALTQSFPEHSSLAQVGVVTNSTHLGGHPMGPLGLGAHHSLGCCWAEVKFLSYLSACPLRSQLLPGPSWTPLLSHLSEHRPPPTTGMVLVRTDLLEQKGSHASLKAAGGQDETQGLARAGMSPVPRTEPRTQWLLTKI